MCTPKPAFPVRLLSLGVASVPVQLLRVWPIMQQHISADLRLFSSSPFCHEWVIRSPSVNVRTNRRSGTPLVLTLTGTSGWRRRSVWTLFWHSSWSTLQICVLSLFFIWNSQCASVSCSVWVGWLWLINFPDVFEKKRLASLFTQTREWKWKPTKAVVPHHPPPHLLHPTALNSHYHIRLFHRSSSMWSLEFMP